MQRCPADERFYVQEETAMRLLATLAAMVILLAVGLRLLFYGFQGLVTSSSPLGQEFLAFVVGLVCFVTGIVCGVLLLKPGYRL
ncbi:MAG TPA: hypothetical protein VFV38_10545 [Ktedonobacteraceae bacterium]|nr:hypothetical protein [Ktedonobacteraceae bacterium]